MKKSSRFERLAGFLGAAGPIAFASAWTLSAAIQSRPQFWLEPASSLATPDADHPWVMSLGFFSWGAATVALAAALRRSLGPVRGSRVGPAVLGLAGLGILVAGVFRADCPGGPPGFPECAERMHAGTLSWMNTVHNIAAGVLFLSFAVSAALLARSFRADDRWRSLSRYSLITGPAIIAAAALYSSGLLPGIAVRILGAIVWIWQVCVATRLARLSSEPAPVASRVRTPSSP